jgi:hypothetical protein
MRFRRCCTWLQVVPTEYVDLKGVSTNSNQFSVTENFRESADAHLGGRSLPGVFFFYDLSPIKVGVQFEVVAPKSRVWDIGMGALRVSREFLTLSRC